MTTVSNEKAKTRVTSISFEDDAPQPLYKKWWFWLGLIVTVGFITVGLYLVVNFGFLSGTTVPISPLAG